MSDEKNTHHVQECIDCIFEEICENCHEKESSLKKCKEIACDYCLDQYLRHGAPVGKNDKKK